MNLIRSLAGANPRRVLAALLLSLSAAQGGGGAADPVEVTVGTIRKSLAESAILRAHPDVALADDGRGKIRLSYRTREWLVYGSFMNGDWTEKPAKETGPKVDGFTVEVCIFTPKEHGEEQWAGRAAGLSVEPIFKNPSGQTPNILRHPYWSSYGCGARIPAKDLYAHVDVDFNNKPNRDLLTRTFEAVREALKAAGAQTE